MIYVKYTPHRASFGSICSRQTRGHSMISLDGKYLFFTGNEMNQADFWFVHGKGAGRDESCTVAPENVILLTTEPQSVLIYPDRYLNQFGAVCTSQENIRHKRVILGPTVLPWYVGFNEYDEDSELKPTIDYDALKKAEPCRKTKLISVITSDKAFTQGHIDRIRFVSMLKNHFGDSIDIFGRGFRDFGDKWDVLHNYRYHVVIENCSQRYYWSEKLGDCYLAGTYPFYYGCTNLSDYFPDGSFTPIDIKDPESAIRTIEKAIADCTYEKSAALLDVCRDLCTDKYNMFEYMASVCETLNPAAAKQSVTIHPCVSGGNFKNLWRYTVGRNYYKIKNAVINRNTPLNIIGKG